MYLRKLIVKYIWLFSFEKYSKLGFEVSNKNELKLNKVKTQPETNLNPKFLKLTRNPTQSAQ